MTQNKIENDMRERIAKFLPDAIARALTSYHGFADKPVTTSDSKEFAAHHSACKVAIAHIELLIKLAQFADLPNEHADDMNTQVILAAMMQEAIDELDDYKKKTSAKSN